MDTIPSPCPKCGGPRYYQGKTARCKACRNAAKHQYNLAHPEKNRTRAAKWATQNRDRNIARSLAWRAEHIDDVRANDRERSTAYRRENPEKRKQSTRKWELANPDKRTQAKQNRRARERQAPGSFTAREWRDLKARYNYRCLCCGKGEPEIVLSTDHIIPLERGGAGFISNIQPLCVPCNSAKGHWRSTDYRLSPHPSCLLP